MAWTGVRGPTRQNRRTTRRGLLRVPAVWLAPVLILSGCASALAPGGGRMSLGPLPRVRGQSSPLDEPRADAPVDLPPLPGAAGVAAAPPPPIPAGFPDALVDAVVEPAACATCGQPNGMLPPLPVDSGGCPTCGTGLCTPGSRPSYPWPAHTFAGRLFGELYQCLCCPDPCYQPRWVYEANAAFFVDWARPQTITRIRNDNDLGMVFPDRATYFWARADGKGIGPQPPGSKTALPTTLPTTTTATAAAAAATTNHPLNRHAAHARQAATTTTTTTAKAALKGQPGLNWYGLALYQEVASARASFFVEVPYRLVDPFVGPSHAGFADMNLGTKSLLLDCELLQLTFQFRTFLPVGNPLNGLGTGHVSLEPSLLSSLKLGPGTYLQGQLAEWIPIAGDPQYSGSILHYHLSLNQVLLRATPDSPLIGTLEFNGWSFQDGLYTDPYKGPTKASGSSYLSLGPGLRMVICDGYDFGVGTAFALTGGRWADQFYRVEFRIRF